MIRMRYLVILFFGMVSLLVGSLLYNSIALAERERESALHIDTTRESIVSIEHVYGPTRDIYLGGLSLWPSWASEVYGVDLATPTFVFRFNPKKTFVCITELWVSATVFVPALDLQLHNASFEITLNNVTTVIETETEIRHYYLSAVPLDLSDFSDRIGEGLNELRIGAWGYDLLHPENRHVVRTCEITLFAEYQYQPR